MSRKHHHAYNSPRWRLLRTFIFNRDGWRCMSCGKAGRLECDHVVPMDQGGGPYDHDNLQTLCRGCHIAKTREENLKPVTAAEADWRDLVRELIKV